MITIKLNNKDYPVVDSIEKITIADSFVVRQNKIGAGNGEKKLYVGNENTFIRSFFGNRRFSARCFLLKKDLKKYLTDTKDEYLKPQQPYRNLKKFPELWFQRHEQIESLPEKITFIINEQSQIKGPRIYINSKDNNYNLLRTLSIPNITFISVVKLQIKEDEFEFYFKLFADYFGDSDHPIKIEKDIQLIENIENDKTKNEFRQARVGQGKYRKELLELCPFCPITNISDDRLLTASHIKPWSKSNHSEKIDPYNGFMFTPTIDRLFDRGYISFTNEKKIMLSPFISKMTYSKLNLKEGKIFHLLPIEGRERYLKHHREFEFEG